MHSLIISILAIALQAAALLALRTYAPAWATKAPADMRLVAAGLTSVEKGFYNYAAANGGLVPAPTTAADGGLTQFQSPVRHMTFLPRAPAGFTWRYGFATDYYLCLESTDSAASMPASLFVGVKRLRNLLPDGQVVVSAGSRSCGSTVNVNMATQAVPAPLSMTFFLRYAATNLPSTDVFKCRGNACLAEKAF